MLRNGKSAKLIGSLLSVFLFFLHFFANHQEVEVILFFIMICFWRIDNQTLSVKFIINKNKKKKNNVTLILKETFHSEKYIL